MRELVERVMADPRYLRNIEYGEPRAGHPEGSVRAHIAHLEVNLERLKPRLPREDYYWPLMFLIHVHDTFKAEALEVSILHPRSHASLARAFAAELTDDADLLNMVQFHDEGYALWRQVHHRGHLDESRLERLLATIQNWDLFLLFVIIDGCTEGKSRDPLHWLIRTVRAHKSTRVDETWILA